MLKLHGRLDEGGGICCISYRPKAQDDDVPLACMPEGVGPWTYDRATRRAVLAQPLHASITLTAALTLRLSASWGACSPEEQARVQSAIDSAALEGLQALRRA